MNVEGTMAADNESLILNRVAYRFIPFLPMKRAVAALFKPGGAQPLDIDRAVTRIDDLMVFFDPFDRQ
jgi:hypothetical protein